MVSIWCLVVSAESASNRVAVILLNGWQLSCANDESTFEASRDTFGQLADLLQTDGAAVFFFNNCSYGYFVSIEQLSAELGNFISNNIRNPDGTPVSQVDLVAHSMEAFLPNVNSGLLKLTLKTDKGQHTLNILTAPAIPPALSISKTHIGSFTQGQTGASYTVIVRNAASAGPTSGTVTVTETVPAGLTLISMSGSGWNCSSLSCTRSDVLSPGSRYPSIFVTANVASNAPSQVTNQVSVSGAGSAGASASDVTLINSPVSTPGRGVSDQSHSTTEQMSAPRVR